MNKVFIVINKTDDTNTVRGVFSSKEKAENLITSIESELNKSPAIPEDIWDNIDCDAFCIIDDDEKYQNNVSWEYNTERQKEVDKAVEDVYVKIIQEYYPVNSEEECRELYHKQIEYEDNVIYNTINDYEIKEFEVQ